jgi:hypothetical protein
LQVDPEMPLPRRFIQRMDVVRLEGRGVVDQERQGAEGSASAADEPAEHGRIAEIGPNDLRPCALGLQSAP